MELEDEVENEPNVRLRERYKKYKILDNFKTAE